MPDLTTAQRLAAYRDELAALGFNTHEAWEIVNAATPLFDDVTVQADLDDTSEPRIPVTVDMVAHVDRESLDRAREEIESSLRSVTEAGTDA
jgi:hypothetical protein